MGFSGFESQEGDAKKALAVLRKSNVSSELQVCHFLLYFRSKRLSEALRLYSVQLGSLFAGATPLARATFAKV